jgi:uncharacterized protein
MQDKAAVASDRSVAPCHERVRTRWCVATRTVRSTREMIRFVAGPNGEVMPDLELRLPGRGAWITARRALVAQAIKRGALARGLKCGANAPADLADILDRLLERSALRALAIAGRSQLVVVGLDNFASSLAEPCVGTRPVVLLGARDAGAGAAARLVSARSARGRTDMEIIAAFTCAQLDLALGRINVVHAALLAGRASETFLARWQILKSFRADEPDQ